MKVKRLKGGKGNRWKKGHSCVSNPVASKHREAAKGRFFHKIDGPSGLTQEALGQHDAALTQVSNKLEELNVDLDDIRSGGKTFNTFASNITTCTIPAFEKFFTNFTPTSEHQTRMLAIHAAAQEYMREQKMSETTTTYFCSLMISLEGIIDSEQDVAAVLSLMARVVRNVPRDVLLAQFSHCAKVLDFCLSRYQESANVPLITNVIGSISVLLRAQDKVQWTFSSTVNLLRKILFFTTHEKPKIRKAAQYNLSAILLSWDQPQQAEPRSHPAAKDASEFCISQLKLASEMSNTKSCLHLLVFLKQVIMAFPKKQMKMACECVLSIMQIGNSIVNGCAMQVLYALLLAAPPPSVFPPESNLALIRALTNANSSSRVVVIVPGINDPQLTVAWITLLTVAHINLCKIDENMGMENVPLWFKLLTPYWRSDHEIIHTKVFESFEALLQECVSKFTGNLTVEHLNHVTSIFQAIESGLSFQYQQAWSSVLKSLTVAFEVLGPRVPEVMTECLKSLVDLMDNQELPQRVALEASVGAAITGLGAEALLHIVPVTVTGDLKEDERKFWLLPLLRKYARGPTASLTFFVSYFVHLASKCFALIQSLKEKGHGESLVVRTYQTVERQVWALLPGFCEAAVDRQAALGNEKFARMLCDHIKFREDTRLDVMSALRNLISAECTDEVLLTEGVGGYLATYAKNYLPALFNVYLSVPASESGGKMAAEGVVDNGQRSAALKTITAYLPIVPTQKRHDFFALIMSKYAETPGTETLKRQALLDLARCFLPYLAAKELEQLYGQVILLVQAASPKGRSQKAAYRILEELLATETAEAGEFVSTNMDALAEVVVSSLSSAAQNSRAPRLRCVKHILTRLSGESGEGQWEEFVRRVVGEAVLCCGGGRSSQATRKAAFLLLQEVGVTVRRIRGCSEGDTVRHCLQFLLAGLVGSPTLVSNSLQAIAALVHQYRDVMPPETISLLISNICVQLQCRAREVVAACLSFVKASISLFPVPVMSDYVDDIVAALCAMVPDCQRKYRLKTKDIFGRLMRKFGADRIMALVPSSDTVLQTRLRNIRKLTARQQRAKEAARDNAKDDSDGDDSEAKVVPASLDEILAEIDADIEDDEGRNTGKKNKKKKIISKITKGTWIRETEDEIFDLLDSSAGQSVMSGRPKLKPVRTDSKTKDIDDEKDDFAVDKQTGKLVITEEKKGKRKDRGKSTEAQLENEDGGSPCISTQRLASAAEAKKRRRNHSDGSDDETQIKISETEPSKKVKGKRSKSTFDYGADFRSKKAGGDMMKKGKVSPYAYAPFTKEGLNKRKKAKFAGQFRSLVKGAQNGVAKGVRQKSKR